jgi:hypothetical protein
MTAPSPQCQPRAGSLRQDEADPYAYRFEYADGSAFQIYANGEAFIVFKDGRREQKRGKVDNRIPLLVGAVAKPRQDRIEVLEAALRLALPYLDNSDSPGGCNGKHSDCGHCKAIAAVRAALPQSSGVARG